MRYTITHENTQFNTIRFERPILKTIIFIANTQNKAGTPYHPYKPFTNRG